MKCKMTVCLLLVNVIAHSQFTDKMESRINTINIATKKITVVMTSKKHLEAPNWSKSGKYFIVNSGGKLYKVAAGKKSLTVINTGSANACNNDHGLSPYGKMLVISHNKNTNDGKTTSAIYTLPVTGGEPKAITEFSPSYWHGWSPDGKTLAYCAERNGNYDVYSIPVAGGKETRLTTNEGLDDGPDYSPDGQFIYYNSYSGGSMQIWRMNADGSNPEQITNDANSNWFAHPSPDGKWIVFISYQLDQGQAHPFGKDVKLRLMLVKDKSIQDLTGVFFGGQGSMNVPSWSPDSKQVAYISYHEAK